MADKLQQLVAPYQDAGSLCLRASLGIIFFAHGAQKLLGWFGGGGLAATGEAFAHMGFWPPLLWALVAGCVEFFGGLLVLAGWKTREAALLLGATMLVAMLKVHWPHGFFMNFALTPGIGHGVEYNIALLGGCLALVFGGPGRYAWDPKPRRKRN